MNIHKGDTVKITVGKDNGKTGKVLRVDVKTSSVLLEGLNTFKKHIRPKKQGEKGQIISLPRPLNVSKIMLICPNCKEPIRVAHRFEQDGKIKVRYCRNCQATI